MTVGAGSWGWLVAFALLSGCGASQGVAPSSTEVVAPPDGRREELVTRTVTFVAAADTHVVATSPTTSFGSSETLVLGRSLDAEAYLRFLIQPFEGTMTTARLRLYVLEGTEDGPTVHDPPGVRTWNELTTWDTRPQWGGYWALVSAGPVASGTWMELDVSDLHVSQSSYLDIFMGGDSPDGVTLASSEHPDPALRPQLVLTIESAKDHPPPRPEPLPVSGTPVSFAPRADTFVSADVPDSSAGGVSEALRVGSTPEREAHLRFSVQGLTETVQRAVLRLRVRADGTEGGPSVFATQGAWSEAVTWNTRPTKVGGSLYRAPFLAPFGFADYDVTEQVRGDGDVTFGLYANSGDEVSFHSREVLALEPQLLVWTGAPRTAPTDDCLTRQEVLATSVLASQDTFVTPDSPTTQHYREASLRVDASPRAESYLEFDVQLGAAPVRRVLLRLYALDASGNGPRLFKAAPFDEATTDWYRKPAIMGGVVGDLGALKKDQWVELDVTDVVTTSGRHAFALLDGSADGMRFASSEMEERGLLSVAPRLVVITDSEPFCSYQGTPPSGSTAWVTQSSDPSAELSTHSAPALDGGFVVISRVEQPVTGPLSSERTDIVTLHRADGSVAWSRAFSQPQVSFEQVVVTKQGNVLVAGSYLGAPDLGTGALPRGQGMFVMKLSPTGGVVWTRGYKAWFQRMDESVDNPMQVLDLATDAHGSALVVGTFWGYTDFGAGPVYSGKPFPYDDTYPNSFVLKLQWDGAYQWARTLTSDSLRGAQATSVAVDAEESVTVGGWAGQGTDFGAGAITQNGAFVARWDASGAPVWSRVIPVYFSGLSTLALLPDGGVVFTGNFGGRFTFAGQEYASREPDEYDGGPRDTMLGRLSATGDEVTLRQLQDVDFHDLVVDASGNVVTSQLGGGSRLGLGDVGPTEEGASLRPTVAGFGVDLRTRWVRVFDPLQSQLLLSPVSDGLVVTADLKTPFELEGTWYAPRERRSDLLHFKLRP
ncbi:DNRLRE domain-containing protein [Myxococcus sp. CA039A]|uniref:CBM96 family carbohydrate-binding protein n=1 Tax=Myxococcus sp. CA039A TaxID=2741737 RepID=UPI00157B7640|nr:DNRLRE domain-containing protein [Myxococcus sp. CA039A]NTX55816.1 DNRLRE domain-containing protein [Myxococcus sp. CA039A]